MSHKIPEYFYRSLTVEWCVRNKSYVCSLPLLWILWRLMKCWQDMAGIPLFLVRPDKIRGYKAYTNDCWRCNFLDNSLLSTKTFRNVYFKGAANQFHGHNVVVFKINYYQHAYVKLTTHFAEFSFYGGWKPFKVVDLNVVENIKIRRNSKI